MKGGIPRKGLIAHWQNNDVSSQIFVVSTFLPKLWYLTQKLNLQEKLAQAQKLLQRFFISFQSILVFCVNVTYNPVKCCPGYV